MVSEIFFCISKYRIVILQTFIGVAVPVFVEARDDDDGTTTATGIGGAQHYVRQRIHLAENPEARHLTNDSRVAGIDDGFRIDGFLRGYDRCRDRRAFDRTVRDPGSSRRVSGPGVSLYRTGWVELLLQTRE